MKKLMSMLLALLMLATGLALAETGPFEEEKWTESVTYYGDGIFIIDFIKDIPWRTEYLLTLTDESGQPMTYIALGGDAGEAIVQVQSDIRADALYTFTLVSSDSIFYAVGQATQGFTYANYCDYCLEFGHDEKACAARLTDGVREVDRCDLCGALDHDDDFCPTRQSGEYCDECGEYGHDDDFCPYDDDGDPFARCGLCGAYGHDASVCDDRAQTTPQPAAGAGDQASLQTQASAASARQVVSSTPQPRQEYCDDCREYGHDDDRCPNERCDECGKTGHDDDNCPDQRCDECGKKGHDDDNCPDQRCDECGKKGHDDDHCPYDRDDDDDDDD